MWYVNSMLVPLMVSAAIIILVYWYITRTFNYWKKRNVRHLPPVPLFGNIKDLALQRMFIGEVFQDIYAKFPIERMVGIYTMTTPAVLLRDPDIIKQILVTDSHLFADRGLEYSKEGLGANLFHADGGTWRLLRTRFTPMFTSEKLKNMFHLLNERGDRLLDYIEEALKTTSQQNMHEVARLYTMSTITACVLGLDIDYNDPSMAILRKIDNFVISNKYRALEIDYMFPGILRNVSFPAEVDRFFTDTVRKVFEQRNGVPTNRNDFMDLALEIRQQNTTHRTENTNHTEMAAELTDGVISAQAFVFYVAGLETSSSTISFLLYEISRHPEIQVKLLNEVDELLQKHDGKISYDALMELPYMTMVINETLRKYPVIDPIQRRAVINYKVPGTNFIIRKGQLIFVPVRGIHYDSKYYPNPEKFDPERFSTENSRNRHSCVYFPFGTGPRNCIGSRFATVQISLFLVKLLSRYIVELSENTPKKITFANNRLILGPSGGTIPLKLVHRLQ